MDPAIFAHEWTDVGGNMYDYNLTINANGDLAAISGPYQAKFLLNGNIKTQAELVILGEGIFTLCLIIASRDNCFAMKSPTESRKEIMDKGGLITNSLNSYYLQVK